MPHIQLTLTNDCGLLKINSNILSKRGVPLHPWITPPPPPGSATSCCYAAAIALKS